MLNPCVLALQLSRPLSFIHQGLSVCVEKKDSQTMNGNILVTPRASMTWKRLVYGDSIGLNLRKCQFLLSSKKNSFSIVSHLDGYPLHNKWGYVNDEKYIKNRVEDVMKNRRFKASTIVSQKRTFFMPSSLDPAKLVNIESVIEASDLVIDQNVNKNLENIIHDIKLSMNSLQDSTSTIFTDPSSIAREDLSFISKTLPDIVRANHPFLHTAAKYFFEKTGKMFRPTVIMLISRALQGSHHKNMDAGILFKQRRLAQVTEMIHVASLVHDDIIDGADTRRGVTTLHRLYGNAGAVQVGDFLLARACFELAHLENHDVSKSFAKSIEYLATGEISQSKNKGKSSSFENYLNSIFYKTAAIIAHSCECAALLAESSQHYQKAAYTYGKHLGMAYQLIDDVLDFTQTSSILGKPSHGADLKSGIATAPVLFAAEQYPELKDIIDREFKEEGDVETVMQIVYQSEGIEKTRQLALTHCKKAMEAALVFEPSDAQAALISLVELARNRKK